MVTKTIRNLGVTLSTIVLTSMPAFPDNINTPKAQDTTNTKLVPNEGGIDEEFLNRMQVKLNQNFLHYVQETDSIERLWIFYPTPKINNPFGISQPSANPQSIEDKNTTYSSNIEILNRLDTKPVNHTTILSQKDIKDKYSALKPDSVPEYFMPVKSLIEKLRQIKNDTTKNDYLKFASMYACIGAEISKTDSLREQNPIKKEDLPKIKGTTIADLLQGKQGHCIHYTTAYLALLKHFGYDCYLKEGYAEATKQKMIEGHMWLSTVINDKEIDLDPFWNQAFIPLEIRNKTIQRRTVSFQEMVRDYGMELETVKKHR